jgi:spermidine synthase
VDIVPHVFDCFPYFHPDAGSITAMPNVRLVSDDGRNFLLVNDEQYDGITIDPAPPLYSAGTVNLYSREFLELCKRRITKEGVVCLWLPPAPKSELLMIMRTFVNVFPGTSLWGSLHYPGFFLTGGHKSFAQTDASIESVARRLAAIPDLTEWDPLYGSEATLKRLFLLNPEELEEVVEGVPEVTDDKPYTEFPMWRGMFTEDGRNVFSANQVREALEGSRIEPDGGAAR